MPVYWIRRTIVFIVVGSVSLLEGQRRCHCVRSFCKLGHQRIASNLVGYAIVVGYLLRESSKSIMHPLIGDRLIQPHQFS